MSAERLSTPPEKPYFIGRGQIVSEFSTAIRMLQLGEDVNECLWQINGFPGIGKSFLIQELQKICDQKSISHSFIDLRTADTSRLLANQREMFERSEGGKKVFVCFVDNAFNRPFDKGPRLEKDMWDYLESIIENPRIMIVLARPNEQPLSDYLSLRMHQKRYTLPPFTLSETIAQTKDNNLGERIYHFTGGHPELNVILENAIQNGQPTDYELATLATRKFFKLVVKSEGRRDFYQNDVEKLLTLALLPRFKWEQSEDYVDFNYFLDRAESLIERVDKGANGYRVCEPLKTILSSLFLTGAKLELTLKQIIETAHQPNLIYLPHVLEEIRRWSNGKKIAVIDAAGVLISHDENPTYNPQATEGLKALKDRGYSLVLWTAERRQYIEDFLRKTGDWQHFDRTICQEDYLPLGRKEPENMQLFGRDRMPSQENQEDFQPTAGDDWPTAIEKLIILAGYTADWLTREQRDSMTSKVVREVLASKLIPILFRSGTVTFDDSIPWAVKGKELLPGYLFAKVRRLDSETRQVYSDEKFFGPALVEKTLSTQK